MDSTYYSFILMSLRKAVEKRAGFKIETSSDFNRLSEVIAESGAGYLSTSTLKRFWGYVKDTSGKHRSTLDILARFAGFEKGFDSFRFHCETDESIESGYGSKKAFDLFSLREGARIEVNWLPDRRLILRCLGNCVFEIESVKNSKIEKGVIVRCSRLIEGDKLVLDVLDSERKPKLIYEAGKVNGITWNLLDD